MIIETSIAVLFSYILFVIVFPILSFPNYYLRKLKYQKTDLTKKIAEKLRAETKEQTLKNIYNYVTKNYGEKSRIYKLANYPKHFKSNVDTILKKPQFLPCHIQNLLISTLLISTGQFKKSNIKLRMMMVRFLCLHQYLIIKADKQKFKVDPFFKILQKLK